MKLSNLLRLFGWIFGRKTSVHHDDTSEGCEFLDLPIHMKEEN